MASAAKLKIYGSNGLATKTKSAPKTPEAGSTNAVN